MKDHEVYIIDCSLLRKQLERRFVIYVCSW
jgi:hypothetical protein